MSKVTDTVLPLVKPITEANGLSLWDITYTKEPGGWYLRIYIDKPGGVTIDDCEAVSRPLSDILDEEDPIEGSYTLEVSSPGLDRLLRTPEHFKSCLGSEVEVRLYRPTEGEKIHIGTLSDYSPDGRVILETGHGSETFDPSEIASVRLFVRI